MAAALPTPEVLAYLVVNLLLAGLLVTPALVTALATRRGGWIGVQAAVFLGVLVAAAAAIAEGGLSADGVVAGLVAMAGFGCLGLALWYFGQRPIAVGRLFTGLAALVFNGVIVFYGLLQWVLGRGPFAVAYDWLWQIDASFDQYLAVLKLQVGGAGLADVQALAMQKSLFVWTIFRLMPSLVALGIVVLVLVNLLLVRRLLPALAGLELNRWRAPDAAIWAVLGPALGLLPYLVLQMLRRDLTAITPWFYVSLNLVLITLAPYILQGLAVMSFFMRRWRFPRFLRGLTYFVVLTQGLVALVPAVGLMEFWTDWRGRALTPRKENDELGHEE